MTQLRFDDRVAIVTGAGGDPSLGRSYALELASRGAKVVVNDLGVGPDGRGAVKANADVVVQAIRDLGGEALADAHSVAESDAAKAIIQTALDAWGRVDVLINNAGVNNLARFDELSDTDVRRCVDTHLLGHIWMCRAAWPHMVRAGYGRIVNITSDAMLGTSSYNVVYGAAKGAIFSLTRGLALSGAGHGIKVNCLGPRAGTVATTHFVEPNEWLQNVAASMPPELVAPVATLLAHESCPSSGKYLQAAAGQVVERFMSQTRGYTNPDLTSEDLLHSFDAVVDIEGATGFGDPTAPAIAIAPKPYKPE